MNSIRLIAPVAALVLLFGCGGSSSDSKAKALGYTAPAGTSWRLLQDESSTDKRLVLNLVGPSGTLARGVGLTVQAPSAKVGFGTFSGSYIQDTGVFDLVNTTTKGEPTLISGGVSGDKLMLGLFQKGIVKDAKDCGAPLLQFVVVIKDGAPTGPVPLTVTKAQILPADLSANQDITVAVGTVSLK